jgi:hypothetical protein
LFCRKKITTSSGFDEIRFRSPFLFTGTVVLSGEPMKFVSPDESSTLFVDQSGKRDLIELKSDKAVHRLFYQNFEPLFQPKLAEAFNTSLENTAKIVPPTFTSAKWLSPDRVEIEGKSSVIINNDREKAFTFVAVASKSGGVTVTRVVSKVQGDRPSRPTPPPTPPTAP